MTTNTSAAIATAIPLSSAEFISLLSSPIEESDLNLSNASLVDVLLQHEKKMRIYSHGYTHGAVIYHIKRIESISNGLKVTPQRVGEKFYSVLYRYLDNEGVGLSSIKNYLTQIRAALNWATQYGCVPGAGYKDIAIPDSDEEKYALSPEEIMKVYNFDLSSLTKTVTVQEKEIREHEEWRYIRGKFCSKTIKTAHYKSVSKVVPLFIPIKMEKLQRVKDMFVLSCMLMQRYSDMKRINPKWFNEDRSIMKVVQQKTGSKAIVNIKTIVISEEITQQILKKYNYYAPYSSDISNYNKYLHELLHLIGGRFLEQFSYETKDAQGRVITKSKPLYKAITSHTGRRTGITCNIRADKSEIKIRRASGHKDGRSFARYNCMKDDE